MNKKELLSHMAKKGDTARSVSKLMGMSEQTFSYKINEKNGREFTKNEIVFLAKKYGFSSDDIVSIFFDSLVSYKDTSGLNLRI